MTQHALSQHLRQILADTQGQQGGPAARCVVGFDGFTDEIVEVVDRRHDPHSYDSMTQMASFGQRIVNAAGKSCNIELVPTRKKLGGNAPIMTNALLEGGHRITFIGAIGASGAIEPLFEPMARRCEKVVSLCPSGHTDAVEFHDGKVMLGKIGTLAQITYEKLTETLPEDELITLFDAADLFASVNWTMLPLMTDLWKTLLKRVVTNLSSRPPDKQRILFIDFADPKKRSDGDVKDAINTLQQYNPHYRVVISLNEAEARRIAYIIDATVPKEGSKEALQTMAAEIHTKTAFSHVVIHAVKFAVAATENGSWAVDGPYCPEPRLTTGAGDNFNAGYCNGLLHGLSTNEPLLWGVTTSGYYVRHGHSPTLEELTDFFEEWSQSRV